jgi:hypothetical protein
MRLLRGIFWAIAAIVVLVEEWLWDPLKRLMLGISRWPGLRALSAAIARLPPRWAVTVFAVPVVTLIPFKMAGLWLIARGQVSLGIVVFLGAKVLGTALYAWLFSLTRPALLSLPWFAWLYGRMVFVRDTVHAWIRRQPAYRAARLAVRRMVRRSRVVFRAWRRRFA